MQGDVLDEVDVARAAKDCQLIVHGVNFPYDQWLPHMENATRSIVKAAASVKATVLFPGNVYGLKPVYNVPLDESHPNGPISQKGELKVRIEQLLQDLVRDHPGSRVLILRANSYFGPTVRNSYVDGFFGAAALGKTINAVGSLDVAHDMVFMPDLARAAVDLLNAMTPENSNAFEVVNFRGHVEPTMRGFLERVSAAAVRLNPDRPKPSIRRVPDPLIWFLGWFKGEVHALREMMYLHKNSLQLGDAKLRRYLPDFRLTPIDEAIESTLKSYSTRPRRD
eukprot:TRINITY_DN3061_c0_g1_i2.p1 TRINITY_DN3061_c0_g1~~TRINITY_DN3061_c0_g1_i2.p1  ORF type:complete len:280 (-),score=65.50 TRINITY_DN3061_c0_g1_i2:233-1072(-)